MTRRRKPPDRALSDEDRQLWAQVTRDVTPLRERPEHAPTGRTGKARRQESAQYAVSPPPPSPPPEPLFPEKDAAGKGGLDRRRLRRLGRGSAPPDSRIDLHGLDRTAAYAQLVRHLGAALRRGDRCVLVITGKGGRRYAQRGDLPPEFRRRADFATGSGILRNVVPHWLDSAPLSEIVSGYGPAHARHGGEGALYVMLRRRGPAAG